MFALQSYAFKFDTTKKNVEQDSLAAEKELLINITTCLKEKKSDSILKCARPLMSESLSDREVKKILFWFAQDVKVTALTVCPKTVTEFIPQRVKLDAKEILCGAYSLTGLDQQAVFFIGSSTASKLKLINLRP